MNKLKMSEWTDDLKYAAFIKAYPLIHYISGKWFNNQDEIKNIEHFLIHVRLNEQALFTSTRQIQNFISYFTCAESTEYSQGKWPESTVLRDARLIKDEELKPLAYPLTQEQLMIINYLLIHSDEEHFFILHGVGGSGKSTFGNIVCQCFDNDLSSVGINELGGFNTAQVVNHRICFSDELSASMDIKFDNLKQLVSKNVVKIERKNIDPTFIKPQTVFMWCCNTRPRISLTDSGVLRRVIYYSMDKPISNPNPLLRDKVWTRDDIVNIVAHALRVDMSNWTKVFEQQTRLNLVKDDSVYRFRFACCFSQYAYFCKKFNRIPYSIDNWERVITLLEEWKFVSYGWSYCVKNNFSDNYPTDLKEAEAFYERWKDEIPF